MLLRSASSWHLLTLGRESWLDSLTTKTHTCRDKRSVMDGSTIPATFTRARDMNLYLKIRQNSKCSAISPFCVAWKMSTIMENAFMAWRLQFCCSSAPYNIHLHIYERWGLYSRQKTKHAVPIAFSKSLNGLIHHRSISNSVLFRFKYLTRHKVKGKKTVRSLV